MKNRIRIYLVIGLFILVLFIQTETNAINNRLLMKKTKSTSNYNVLGENINQGQTVKIKVNDSVFYETLVGSYGGVPTGNELEFTMTEEQINNLETFEYTGTDSKKIKDITGIKNFINLKTVRLNKNQIADITEINELTNLKVLEIQSNGLKELPDLSKLSMLEKLNISTNGISNIDVLKQNTNLKELYASTNQISDITSIVVSLKKLETLDLNNNRIYDVSTISYLNNLKYLDLSNNMQIRDIEPITNLTTLQTLNLNNDNSIENLYMLVKANENDEEGTPLLIGLKKLYLDKVNSEYSSISLGDLCALNNIEVLNLNNDEISSIEGVTDFKNLKELYLNNNQIEDISPLVKIEEDGDGKIIITKSPIEKLSFENNMIEKVDVLSYFSKTINYLNLKNNNIHNISDIEEIENLESKNLFLQNQKANFMIKRKDNTSVKQAIMIENIIKNCKITTSKIYERGADFTVEGAAKLNTDNFTLPNGVTESYSQNPKYYNIVFEKDVQEGDVCTIKINGGRADGSIYTYTITSDGGEKVYDSIIFEDYYLTGRIASDLIKQEKKIVGYIPYIIIIENPEIADITELDLSGKYELNKISNIKGLESFENLTILNLSDNNISSNNSISRINLLKDLPNIERINLSGNKLENTDVISNYQRATHIYLSNNKINNLNGFETLIQKLKNNESEPVLIALDLSGNEIEDLTQIKDIVTLKSLNLNNNNINNIKPIENMVNLSTLYISKNKIDDISIISKLTKLTTLYMASNNIRNISSIKNLGLSILDISSNKIDNLEDLKNMTSLQELKASANRINSIEPIKNFSAINKLDMNSQSLCYTLLEGTDDIVLIELPKLFKEAKEEGLINTAESFAVTNCELTEDNKIKVDAKNLGHKIATVKINGGNAAGSQLSIAEPLKPIVEYSIKEKTNQDVVATVKFDGRQANIMNNDGNNNYTFTKNGEFTFEYEDEYGFTGKVTAIVDWIDKEPPKTTVTLDNSNITNQDVTVTITTDEECKQIEGWTLSADKKTLTKRYSKNVNEKVTVEDELGNKTVMDVIISNIDKTAPIVTGIENNKKYNTAVTPKITDENLETVELKKGENKVAGFESENSITENGEYTLTAKDKAGNITIVKFTIDIPSETVILNSISITKAPNKTEYTEGENFDKTEMKVTAIYSNGNTKEVTNYIIIDGNNLSKDKTTIIIKYTEGGVTRQATQNIRVQEKVSGELEVKIKGYEEKTAESVKYIKGIRPQTTIENLKNNIETNGTIKIKNTTTEITDENTKIGTGMILEISLNNEKKEYTLVVIGDCNGSGTTNVADLTKLMMSRAESLADNKDESKILKGSYAEAVDLNNDGKISVADITLLCKFIAENK